MCIHVTMSKTKSQSYVAPSRKGKTLIGAHFDPAIKRQLKTIAVQEDTSIQALLEEAINNLICNRETVSIRKISWKK